MAVTYTTAVKTDRMTATRDYHVSGSLVIMTAADAVLVTYAITNPGGTVTGDTWTLAFTASTVAAGAAGTAAKAEVRNSGGTAGITGLTVGTAATDIILDNTSIANGQNVTLSSATIQHAA
jgi:hypothetical protein